MRACMHDATASIICHQRDCLCTPVMGVQCCRQQRAMSLARFVAGAAQHSTPVSRVLTAPRFLRSDAAALPAHCRSLMHKVCRSPVAATPCCRQARTTQELVCACACAHQPTLGYKESNASPSSLLCIQVPRQCQKCAKGEHHCSWIYGG